MEKNEREMKIREDVMAFLKKLSDVKCEGFALIEKMEQEKFVLNLKIDEVQFVIKQTKEKLEELRLSEINKKLLAEKKV